MRCIRTLILGYFLASTPLYSKIENLESIAHQYVWMDELVRQEFRVWRKIDTQRLNQAVPPGFLRVTITGGKPSFSSPLPSDSSQSRFFFELIKILCETYRVPDVTFLYWHHDGVVSSPQLGIPVLVGCRRGDIPDAILFGDWNFSCIEWDQFTEEMSVFAETVPWEERIKQIVWRGKNTDGSYNNSNYSGYSRGASVAASLQHPEMIDARFYASCQWHTQEPLAPYLFGDYKTPFEQSRYRYQLVITGALGSYPNDRWKLFTGSTLFWIPHNEVLWYHYALRPYVHYIPTQGTPDAILSAYIWAETHPIEAKKIAENGMQFAKNNLQASHFLFYMYKVLKKYASLCR